MSMSYEHTKYNCTPRSIFVYIIKLYCCIYDMDTQPTKVSREKTPKSCERSSIFELSHITSNSLRFFFQRKTQLGKIDCHYM